MTGINDLSDTQLERFQRHLGLVGFGPEAQQALLDSRILVIGAGGLGSPILQYLGAAGVGHIEIVDDDVVDRSNLHRQVIHSEADLGRPKTESAADVVRGLNPDAEVVEHRFRITPENALELVRPVDLVIDGSDNFLTRYIVSDAAEILSKPVVYGAILRFEGQVGVFWAGHGPTYRDLFPEAPGPGEVPSCAEAGVIGVLPGVIGTLMATEAIKVLTGIGDPLLGRVMVYDALAASFQELRLEPDPQRPKVTSVASDLAESSDETMCAVAPPSTPQDEISPTDLNALLEERDELMIVDVREPWENRLGAISGAANVPLGDIQRDSGKALGARLDKDSHVVLYCKAGVRSRKAMDILAEVRPDVEFHSLSGGYDEWSATFAD
ncbi:molybdopterin-synthase adenylyltransferase MoeB [Rothia uropygialis]|uniref:molybdopterin-synthase adenylyltransferase MoeB n=1 Tax=Kocuria sp. 36 TaxID=1415402 RepID=UPI00101CB96B|nr:molybdopterin-synthase adenylyltransferase MoeB [Kocuria sp. 36]